MPKPGRSFLPQGAQRAQSSKEMRTNCSDSSKQKSRDCAVRSTPALAQLRTRIRGPQSSPAKEDSSRLLTKSPKSTSPEPTQPGELLFGARVPSSHCSEQGSAY